MTFLLIFLSSFSCDFSNAEIDLFLGVSTTESGAIDQNVSSTFSKATVYNKNQQTLACRLCFFSSSYIAKQLYLIRAENPSVLVMEEREQCAACFLRYRRKYVGYNAGIQPSLNTAANVAKLIDWSRTVLCPSSTPFLCLHISVHLYQTFWSKSLPRRAMLKADDKFVLKIM